MPENLAFVLQFFDGRHSALDIRAAYLRQFGSFLFQEQLTELIQNLDANYFLENERSRARYQEISAAFEQQPFRTPLCAGASYAAEGRELNAELDRFTQLAVVTDQQVTQFAGQTISAIVVPHIDPRLGGPTYAAAYKTLAQAAPADLYVILGIGHQSITQSFALTDKDFDTPLGRVQTEKKLVAEFKNISPINFSQEQLAHRDEHSIEFQTLFLKHFIPGDFKILPILCSFSYETFKEPNGAVRQTFESFTELLRRILSSYRGRICLIASVDLAHIGPRYGDARRPDHLIRAHVERHDRDLLQCLGARDQRGFQELFEQSRDRYRVCGYSALITLLALSPPGAGRLLDYQQATMDDAGSVVSFASMIFC